MKKLIFLLILGLASCSTNLVYVEKNIYIIDSNGSEAYSDGSDIDDALKGNNQRGGDPDVSIPLP